MTRLLIFTALAVVIAVVSACDRRSATQRATERQREINEFGQDGDQYGD